LVLIFASTELKRTLSVVEDRQSALANQLANSEKKGNQKWLPSVLKRAPNPFQRAIAPISHPTINHKAMLHIPLGFYHLMTPRQGGIGDVQSLIVLFLDPFMGDFFGMLDVPQDVGIQYFTAVGPIESLYNSILLWMPRLDCPPILLTWN